MRKWLKVKYEEMSEQEKINYLNHNWEKEVQKILKNRIIPESISEMGLNENNGNIIIHLPENKWIYITFDCGELNTSDKIDIDSLYDYKLLSKESYMAYYIQKEKII